MRAGSIRLPVRPAWTTRWRCFWALPKSRRGRSPDLLLRRCSHRSLQRRVVPPPCEPRHTRGAHNPELLYNIDLVAAVGNGAGDSGRTPEPPQPSWDNTCPRGNLCRILSVTHLGATPRRG